MIRKYHYLSSEKLFGRSIVIPISFVLILSAFTHLWNPLGFPSIFIDEGHYMRRVMHVINGLSPQEPTGDYTKQYDHPYFGQLFLAAVLSLIGYPNSNIDQASSSVQTTEMLYITPRIVMGILAIVDTFFIYKIVELRYDRKVAFIAAVLFAVMPIGWMTRRILLEPIFLPLILSSILFAVYYISRARPYKTNKINDTTMVLLSGIFLGLAIFTKLPALAMIPLVGFLIYLSNKNLKLLALWFAPVILIPLIWPAYAISLGDFDEWLDGVQWQSDREIRPLLTSMNTFFELDPILFSIGIVGVAYTALKRDFFPLLWVFPFLLLFAGVGHSKAYFLIPIFPAFCIAGGVLITDLTNKILGNKKKMTPNRQLLPFAIISAIGVFGLISTTMLITTNINSSFFNVYGFMIDFIKGSVGNSSNGSDIKEITLIGDHWIAGFAWIPNEVLDYKLNFIKFFSNQEIKNENVILVVSEAFEEYLQENFFRGRPVEINAQKQDLFTSSKPVAIFKDNSTRYDKNVYPYVNMRENGGVGNLEIRTNH
jgi:hypothetical protein